MTIPREKFIATAREIYGDQVADACLEILNEQNIQGDNFSGTATIGAALFRVQGQSFHESITMNSIPFNSFYLEEEGGADT